MTTLKCIPGFLWCLPISFLVWLFFCLPNYIRGTFCDIWIDEHLCITWEIDMLSDFYENAMEGWFGFVLGCNRIVVDIDRPTREASNDEETENYKMLRHELRHVFQNYCWGIFFYPVYILATLYLWIFEKDKHAYLDNPFERNARKFAGQKVDIPREEWPDGKNDRFPWW